MKKTIPTLLLAGIAGLLSAQPVITDANYTALPGESIMEYTLDTVGFNPGAGGAGMTWNFTGIPGLASYPVSVLAPAASPYNINFPSATTVFYREGNYEHFETGASGQVFLGGNLGATVIGYSDLMQALTYPFTYLSTFSDDFYAGYNTTGGNVVMEGSITVTADGYGTITTPAGTFSNVLRIKSEMDYVQRGITGDGDSTAGGDSSAKNFKIITYDWVKPGTHFPLFSFRKETVGTQTHPVYVRYIQAPKQPTGIDEFIYDAGISVYPNPASTSCNITCTEPMQKVEVFNSMGARVISITPNSTNAVLDIAHLTSGLYLVNIASGAQTISKTLVVE